MPLVVKELEVPVLIIPRSRGVRCGEAVILFRESEPVVKLNHISFLLEGSVVVHVDFVHRFSQLGGVSFCGVSVVSAISSWITLTLGAEEVVVC